MTNLTKLKNKPLKGQAESEVIYHFHSKLQHSLKETKSRYSATLKSTVLRIQAKLRHVEKIIVQRTVSITITAYNNHFTIDFLETRENKDPCKKAI